MTVRHPRVAVSANGVALDGVSAVTLHSSGAFQADRFEIELVLRPDDLAWWSETDMILLEIGLSLDGTSFVSMMLGQADRVVVDPLRGRVRAEGRDLSARLIDAPAGESFDNRTASEIAGLLAQRHGLTAVVTPVGDLSGRYYQADHSQLALGRLARARTEWDLLSTLARQIGYDLFVSGQTLYFTPPSSSLPYALAWNRRDGSEQISALQLVRLPGLAQGVQVSVRSWHSQDGQVVTGSAGRAGGMSTTVLRPNLKADAAQQLAAALQMELQTHQRQISLQMPGELDLTARSVLRLDGDLAGWSGCYQVVELTRRIDMQGGFQQSVVGRSLN